MKRRIRALVSYVCIFIGTVAMFASCTKTAPLGTESNPIKMFFIPSQDADRIFTQSEVLGNYIKNQTGLHIKMAVPASYIAVVEAFGTKKADVAFLNTFGYILAHEKYGAEARLRLIRHGLDYYQGQFIARSDSGIEKVQDFNGKKFAFTDPSSTSGFLFPTKMLKENQVNLKETVFASKHDSVVTMVYQKQVDGGATFYSPPTDKGIQDARKIVRTQFPDIEQKVKIVGLTEKIPNDPVSFRKDIAEDIKIKITDSLLSFSQTEEGKKVLDQIYNISGFTKTSDEDYRSIQTVLTELGKDVSSFL